jgi:hypothetical protein
MANFPETFLDEFRHHSGFDNLGCCINPISDLPPAKLRIMLEEIQATCGTDAFPGGVLPRVIEKNIVYYLVARNAREWRHLRPLALAFAGPTITTFPRHLRLKNEDPAERVLLNANFIVAKLGVPSNVPGFERRKLYALHAVHRLAVAASNCPKQDLERRQTTAELLDRFEYALDAGNSHAAEEVLDELRQRHHLDALNLKFMRVELLARFGKWEELRSSSFFLSLTMTRRPGRITSALVEALYRTTLVSREDELKLLVTVFRTELFPQSGALFERLPRNPSWPVFKSFAIYAASAPESSAFVRQGLEKAVKESDDERFEAFWGKCREFNPQESKKITFSDLVRIPPDPDSERARDALAVAFRDDDPLEARAALTFFAALEEGKRFAVLSCGNFHAMWRHLNEIALDSWEQWFAALDQEENTNYRDLVILAMDAWPATKKLADSSRARDFRSAMEGAVSTPLGQKRLVECLPRLVQWLQEDANYPSTEAVPVYLFCLELYALAERISEEALDSFALLLDGTLGCGLDAAQYAEAIDAAVVMAEQVNGARAQAGLLELADLAVDHQAPNTGKRVELLWSVLVALRRIKVNLSRGQRESLSRVMRLLGIEGDVNFEELRDAQEGTSPLDSLAHRHVAIYTLAETSGRRAMETLKEIVPSIRVSLNCDKVGSEALRNIARSADYLVMATRAAKHAATQFIERHRPQDMPIIYPQGKGTSSILRSLESL